MFLVTLVLNNLINGLAVCDTGRIMENAAIRHQQMFVDILSYSDYMVHSSRYCAHFLYKKFKCCRPLFHLFDTTELLLIESKCSGNAIGCCAQNREVQFVRTEKVKETSWREYCLQRFNEVLLWDVSDVIMKNEIILEGKKILIERKKNEITQYLRKKEERNQRLELVKLVAERIERK